MNTNKKSSAFQVAIAALAIALVCVSTMMIQIPIPLGYMHLGNCCILLIGVYFGPTVGMLAGGLGSALADLLTYPQWALPTLLIKGLMGWAIGKIASQKESSNRVRRFQTFLASVAGILIMIIGYFIAGAILYGGIAVGAAQIPGLTLEGVIGIILFYILAAALEAAHVPAWFKRFS
ncbi:MAG: ECF transporter S component [Clostridiales bacterium]|nr:ECF transporter S component [Clostridiales bacterium]